MTKFKWFMNYSKEERWLEQMAKQGYQLQRAGFVYTFHSAQPEQAVIKIDYRLFKTNQDFLDYCSLFEDSGWKHIAGTKNSGSQYFKKTGSGTDIFSDSASRAGRYKRLSEMWMSISLSFLPLLVILVTSENWINMDAFYNPKALYYTPGLWDMNGFDFWRRFLFETPFALVRGYFSLVWLAFVLLYILFSVKSWRLYKRTLSADG